MKREKKRWSLSVKFTICLLIVGIGIMAAAIIVGVWTYSNSITKRYNETAYQVAKTAQGYLSEQQLSEYADLVYDYNTGKATKEEIEKAQSSDTYRQMKANIDHLRESMKANDIFLFVFNMDILEHYDAEADARHEWKALYYIADSYHVEAEQMEMGTAGSIYEDFIEDSIHSYETGKPSDNYYISKGSFGYNTSAMYPVVQNGKTIAFIGVEIPMSTLKSDVKLYIGRIVRTVSILTILFLLIAVYVMIHTLVRPIKLVADEAKHFVENNNEISTELEKIKTRDEVQVLSESLLNMEIGIRDYIKNLREVTAEKERIGTELNVATKIQADMLPSIFPAFPERDEFDIYATMNPAKEVGGDFYDFFLVDEDHLVMVMADVSGKGVPAALFMVIAKTLIKNSALNGLSPKEILETVNDQLCENNEAEMFVTVWLGKLTISTGKMVCVNAGHEYPVIRRFGGAFELIKDKHGFVVAGMEGVRYKEYELELQKGDRFFIYTDGVAEATNASNELFGTERMLQSLNQTSDCRMEEHLTLLKKDIDSFVGTAPQFDDITMLALEYRLR